MFPLPHTKFYKEENERWEEVVFRETIVKNFPDLRTSTCKFWFLKSIDRLGSDGALL